MWEACHVGVGGRHKGTKTHGSFYSDWECRSQELQERTAGLSFNVMEVSTMEGQWLQFQQHALRDIHFCVKII